MMQDNLRVFPDHSNCPQKGLIKGLLGSTDVLRQLLLSGGKTLKAIRKS